MAVDFKSKDEPVDTRTPADALIDTSSAERAAALRRSRTIGYLLLVATSVGWGLNWPVTKRLLSELPPLSLRGLSGIIGAALLAVLALAFRQSLKVPHALWPRLVLLSLLNVTAWMALMGLALTFLPASEAAVMAYTMPVWASVLAWPILGERISLLRVVAMAMAIAGLVALMGGGGVSATQAKLPGILLALAGAFLFAVGTVLAKRWPLMLPPLTSAVWQILIGCIPVSLAGLLMEQPHFTALSSLGWSLFAYSIVVQFCVAYACWFAALQRLPASVAAIGTLLVPVIGVVASATALGEPLGMAQIAALGFTIAGVVLASRS
jgi:drug/metabolite transporter (DMT)-like permease